MKRDIVNDSDTSQRSGIDLEGDSEVETHAGLMFRDLNATSPNSK